MNTEAEPTHPKDPDDAPAPDVVLVIDDEEHIRDTLRRFLCDLGYTVLEAGNALDARNLLEEKQFHVNIILLDLVMPEVSGEDFLEWVKAVAPTIPVVIISGNRTDDVLVRCLARGAADFVDKPFQIDQLQRVIKKSIQRQQSMVEQSGELSASIPTADWVELSAPSEMEYLSRIQLFSEKLFASRFPTEVMEDLRLAMEELGRNAIEWGNKFDREKMFRISYCIFSDRVVFKFEDEGEGFNWNQLIEYDPSKDPLGHLNSRKEAGKRPGGFGVFMMRNMMDEIVYNEKGNTCVMTKYIRKKDESTE